MDEMNCNLNMQTSAHIEVFGFRSRQKVVKGVIPPILSALAPPKKMAADLHLNALLHPSLRRRRLFGD